MRKAVKYVVLGVSCVVCALVLYVMFALLAGIGELSNPLSLMLPILAFCALIVGCILLTIWAFKFSDDKEHKKALLLAVIVLFSGILLFPVSSIVNGIMRGDDVNYENVVVGHDAYMHISVDSFVKTFNSKIDSGYNTLPEMKYYEKGKNLCHSCNLTDNIAFELLSNKKQTKVVNASVALNLDSYTDTDAQMLGYYYSKLIYTVMPEITDSELLDIVASLKLTEIASDFVPVGDISYYKQIEDGKLKIGYCGISDY